MTVPVAPADAPEETSGSSRLAVLLAMAMFVLVVDTSLMNVSISAVVEDLDTTVSGVQSAIALEALVSAAFILISSKIGDLIGRKRAYVLGLLGYAVGAIAMTLAEDLRAVIVFWAIIGGLGASLLLPAMQSLIHGNFEGPAQKRAYALVGASAAIAAAVGPLLGGFVTTYLSWRVGFLLEAVVIAIVLSGLKEVRDAIYTGPRQIDLVGAALSVVGMGGVVLGILVWQEGGEAVGLLMVLGAIGLAGLAYWLVRRRRANKPALLDPDLFRVPNFRLGITQQMMQQITLGGAMIALPIFLQMTLEYDAMKAGLSIAPLSLSMFGVALLAGRRGGNRRPSTIVGWGFALALAGMVAIIPIVPRAESGWALLIPLMVAGAGLGLLVSQLNNYTLAPISEERISEAAGVNSAAGSFGLSFGLAMGGGLMLAALSLAFTDMTEASDVIPPSQQATIAEVLEDDAQVMSNTQLDELLPDEPEAVQEEILRINADARDLALQVALLVPALACAVGLFNSRRMARLPDIAPSADLEGVALGVTQAASFTGTSQARHGPFPGTAPKIDSMAPHHDHDDRHDRGLLYDLAVLRERRLTVPRRYERRGALKLLGGAGMGLLLVACGSDSSSGSDTTASPTSTTTGATSTTAASGSSGDLVTDAIPEETGGPYPGDGSNGPNVLTESGVVRRDIRSSFGDYSGTADGVDVGIDLTIVNAGDGSPFAGAALYIWHCTADGGYSLYSQGVEQENFLRGVQEADRDGKLSFTSIYPGAYDGRWPHIHFEVFGSLADATRASGKVVTSQIALPEDVSRSVYESSDRYSRSVSNLDRTSLDSDMVFRDGAELQLPTMSGDVGSNLRMALTIAV